MAESAHAALLREAKQEHVLEGWAQLSAAEREQLDAQIADLDDRIGIRNLKALLADVVKAHEAAKAGGSLEPAPREWVGFADGSKPEDEARWEKIGLGLVAQNKCAACVLAGGQGTRLGFGFPKGMLGDTSIGPQPLNLASGKSLFQLQAERIRRVQSMAQAHAGLAVEPTIFFLVMTVDLNHKVITDFFERHAFFGLKREQVIFFPQGVMPCLGEDGRMLMATPGTIATSPDGNAGIYPALRRNGVLSRLTEAGVKWVQSFSVDNILVRAADPVWYGFCEDSGADVAVKTIPKRSWNEAVGVLTLRDGKPGVIEYSEIGEQRAQETDVSGQLKYNAANICLQAYSLDFLSGAAQDFASKTPLWHLARKQIDTKDGKVPGCKLEGFIFDCFAVSSNIRLLQVDRSAEFSAIKNATDSGKSDTPATALEMLSRLHRQWLRNAGAKIPVDEDGSGVGCEISPLASFRGEALESRAQTVEIGSGPVVVD